MSQQPTPKPQLLLLVSLGLLSPVFAYAWHGLTGAYIQDVFSPVVIVSYLMVPVATWFAAANRSAALFGYTLATAIPAAIGINAIHALNLARIYEQHSERVCGVSGLILLLSPILIGVGHLLGAGLLTLAAALYRRFYTYEEVAVDP